MKKLQKCVKQHSD